MNISMQLTVVAAVCLCVCAAVPEGRLARKSQRPTRGFKNVEMMTARGFGKRDHAPTRSELYGLDNFWEKLDSGLEKNVQGGEDKLSTIPVDPFIEEMLNNPEFARTVVRKFIDLNQDGLLSSDELFGNAV